MKKKLNAEKTGPEQSLFEKRPFLSHVIKDKKIAHLDEYEGYVDLAELDLGDGFNAFDEDFYNNLYY